MRVLSVVVLVASCGALAFHRPLDNPDAIVTEREYTAGEEVAGVVADFSDRDVEKDPRDVRHDREPAPRNEPRATTVRSTRRVGRCGRNCVVVTAEAFVCP